MFTSVVKRRLSGRRSSRQHEIPPQKELSDNNNYYSTVHQPVKSALKVGSDRSMNSGGSNCLGSEQETETATTHTPFVTRSVQFQHVEIVEYERIISDNPSCSSGAPIGIGWAHGKERTMRLDDFESARPRRRNQNELVLSRQDREELLLEWGATFQDIIDAIRANIRAKNQRRRTVNNLGTYDKWEEAMESASRKLKRTLLLQKSADRRAEKMKEQSEKVAESTALIDAAAAVSVDRSAPIPISIAQSQQPASPTASDDCPATIMESDSTKGEQQGAIHANHHDGDGDGGPSDQPASLVEVDVASQQNGSIIAEDDFNEEMMFDSSNETSDVSAITMHSSQEDSSDGFSRLQRDDSFWEVDGSDSPVIRRKLAPVVISEDNDYDLKDFDHNWENGFLLQPPPRSNSIINSWE